MAFAARVAVGTMHSASARCTTGTTCKLFTSLACAVSYCRLDRLHHQSAASCVWWRAKRECRASPSGLTCTMRSRPLAFGLGPVGESSSTQMVPAPLHVPPCSLVTIASYARTVRVALSTAIRTTSSSALLGHRSKLNSFRLCVASVLYIHKTASIMTLRALTVALTATAYHRY